MISLRNVVYRLRSYRSVVDSGYMVGKTMGMVYGSKSMVYPMVYRSNFPLFKEPVSVLLLRFCPIGEAQHLA